MKTFIFKVENMTKNPSIYGGRKQKAIIYQFKKGKLEYLGETHWNTASYRGAESCVNEWLLENKIIPAYYNKGENGISKQWMDLMKNSIMSTGGKYSTARMLVDYTNNLYMPLCNLNKKYYTDLGKVTEFNSVKQNLYTNWNDIVITQEDSNLDNITIDAGNKIEVTCKVRDN